MTYADYTYYALTYHGNAIASDDFLRLALRASERVDAMTRFRAEAYFAEDPEPIRRAVCAIAEAIQRTERECGGGAAVQQERMDNYSVTYGLRTAEDQRRSEYAAAAQYLMPTGLLYSGVSMRRW